MGHLKEEGSVQLMVPEGSAPRGVERAEFGSQEEEKEFISGGEHKTQLKEMSPAALPCSLSCLPITPSYRESTG